MGRYAIGSLALAAACLGAARAQPLEQPLPQALTGEANRAYESLIERDPTPAFHMPARVETPVWFRSEALFSVGRAQQLPPLLSTSPDGTSRTDAGILGTPGTRTVIGGSAGNGYRDGVAFGFGVMPFPDYACGLELGYAVRFGNERTFTAASGGSPILGRPFTIGDTGAGQAALVTFPGLSSGTFLARALNGNLHTANVSVTDRIVDAGDFHLTLLAGYRRFDVNEEINLLSNVTILDATAAPVGTTIRTFDRFRASNRFQGGELGLRAEAIQGPFALEATGRLAVGGLEKAVDVTGNTISVIPGGVPNVSQGGFLALTSNIGRRTERSVQVMPEFGLTGKWQMTRRLEARIGYQVFLLQGIVRAADQIDPVISSTNNLPPATSVGTRPAAKMDTTNLWINNLSLGLTLGF